MEQEQLFIDTREDAIAALAMRIGGKKRLASLMWPNEDIDKAHHRLLAKLDSSRREILSVDDWDRILVIGATQGCHICKWWQDDNTAYQRSQPSEPKDSDDELAHRIESATEVLAKALDIYTRRLAARELKAVK